jgi:hypothetical protein
VVGGGKRRASLGARGRSRGVVERVRSRDDVMGRGQPSRPAVGRSEPVDLVGRHLGYVPVEPNQDLMPIVGIQQGPEFKISPAQLSN